MYACTICYSNILLNLCIGILCTICYSNSEHQRGAKHLAKGALHVEGVIHCLDSLCTYRGRYTCLPIMHSTALMYLPGAAILNTLCSDEVTYPDHVVPLHVGEWSIRIPKSYVTLPWDLTFYFKHFATGFF